MSTNSEPPVPLTPAYWGKYGPRRFREASMLDVIFVLGGLAFFAISVGYTVLCDRL